MSAPAPLNGHAAAAAPDDLRTEVAKSVHIAVSPTDEGWDDLAEDAREDFLSIADHAMVTHIRGMLARRFKIVPPGAVPSPASSEEAAAMIRAAQGYLAEQAKKPGLVAPKRKLIVPGAH